MTTKLIVIEGEVARMELTQGRVALIDAADVAAVVDKSWHAVQVAIGRWYVRAGSIYLHRFLLDPPRNMDVDHINHDTFDNRRANLRVISHQGNLENRKGANSNSTTGLRGVYVHKVKHRDGITRTYYNVRVMVDGKSKTKNFPFTPEGLELAKAHVEEMRGRLMEYA